tara:strand:+ start:350 stop:994 length:645 start_codon:yes stop_codon:yes gene_type:complete
MLLDLHTHSTDSDDSRASVEQYVKWINILRKKGNHIDGFVVTDHRQFNHDLNYDLISSENGITILKGAELDTDTGHFLVYGINEKISSIINFADVTMSAQKLVDVCDTYGGIAFPAHPGRAGIGFAHYLDNGVKGFETVKTAELLNGSNRPGEGEKAEELIQSRGFNGTGGSDAHIVSAIGTCMTEFEDNISNENELVAAIRSGSFKAVRMNKN